MRKIKRIRLRRICRFIIFSLLLLSLITFAAKAILESKWDAKSRYTIAVDSVPLVIFSVEPNTNTAAVILIPPNTILDVPYDYNTYPANSVFALGELDSQKGGGKLLSKSIENTFGLMVDGYIAVKNSQKLSVSSEIDQLYKLKNNYLSITALPKFIFSILNNDKYIAKNISFIDLMRLWMAVRNIRNDRIAILDLDKNDILAQEKLPDGSLVRVLNKEMFDQTYATNFEDRQVRLQNISIEVVNATDKEKIAGQFSRTLHNLGANVVVKSTSPVVENFNCKVYASSKELLSGIITKRLEKYFHCISLLSLHNQSDAAKEGKPVETSVADIKVVLGKEFVK